MVYRSLGFPCEQRSIWQRIAEEVRAGVHATRTHRLARDACQQGFEAAILQTDQPAELLKHLVEAKVRVILNHRLDRHSPCGHYSVLLRFDGRIIELHDPERGPGRALPWSEFAEYWGPIEGPSETVGNVLVAIAPRSAEVRPCATCGRAGPAEWLCPRCGQSSPVGAVAWLGCSKSVSGDPLWRRRFCPHCDWAAANRGECETNWPLRSP